MVKQVRCLNETSIFSNKKAIASIATIICLLNPQPPREKFSKLSKRIPRLLILSAKIESRTC